MSGLALGYVFDPAQAEASTPGQPTVIHLTVTASSQPGQRPQFTEITILIPAGDPGDGGSLSDNPQLPAPGGGPFPGGVQIAIAPGRPLVTITPPQGSATFTIPSALTFTLPGIRVSPVPGQVTVTITETTTAPGGQTATATDTRQLTKTPSHANPIATFTATPPAITRLSDLDQPVTLTWTANTGSPNYNQHLVYGLSVLDGSSGPGFRDCLGAGDCYTEQDGRAGVATPPVSQTTTFQLQAITTQDADHRTIVGTISCRVPVTVPRIAPESLRCQQLPTPSRRLVLLHWIAQNADRCSVFVGSTEVITDGPTDTYADGYAILLTQPAGTYDLSVMPHSGAESGVAAGISPPVTITGASPVIPLPAAETPKAHVVSLSAAATAGRAIAALHDPTWPISALLMIDTAARKVTVTNVSGDKGLDFSGWHDNWPQSLGAVAMSPDGSTCYALTRTSVWSATGQQIQSYWFYTMDWNTVVADNPDSADFGGENAPLCNIAAGYGIYADGVYAIVGGEPAGLGVVFGRPLTNSVSYPGSSQSNAGENRIRRSGDAAWVPAATGEKTKSTWLVSAPDVKSVLLIAGTYSPSAYTWGGQVLSVIEVPDEPMGIDVTADGTQALVACQSGYVSVIDVPGTRQSDRIPVPDPVFDVAVLRDGSYAFAAGTVAGTGSGVLYVIDLRSNPRRAVGRLAVDAGLGPVAATADGGLLIASGGSVLLL